MGEKLSSRCPKCGGRLRFVDGSDRTVPGGTWYAVMCPRCLHMVWDVFKPRRYGKVFTDSSTGTGGA